MKKITAVAVWKLKGPRMEVETVGSWFIVLHGRCWQLEPQLQWCGEKQTDVIHILFDVDLANSLFNKHLLSLCSEQSPGKKQR